MTVTFRYLVGTKQSLDKVIDYHLTTNWNSANTSSITPDIENSVDEPDYNAQLDRTGPNKILLNILSRRKVPIEAAQEPNGDYTHEWVTDISVDVYAEDMAKLQLFEDEINRILWEIAPNNSVRLDKSDGNDSEVFMFEENELEFDRIQPEGGRINDNPASQAILRCHWFKDKS